MKEQQVDEFMIRLRECNTQEVLERLHDHVRRTVPVSQRLKYIEQFNLREEVIMRSLYQDRLT